MNCQIKPIDSRLASSPAMRPGAPLPGCTTATGLAAFEFVDRQARQSRQDAREHVNALAPALGLTWLPTLEKTSKARFVEVAQRYFSDGRYALLADRPARLDVTAVMLLGSWRARIISNRDLRRGAEDLLTAADSDSGEWGEGWEASQRADQYGFDPVTVSQVLHTVLVATRLAGLRLGRNSRRVIGANLRQLETFLASDLLHSGTLRRPLPEVTLCAASELWRQTTPWTASIRLPLEVAIWERWQELPRLTDPTSSLALSSLIIAADNLHLDVDLPGARRRLAILQAQDGSFDPGPWLCLNASNATSAKDGANNTVGCRTVTTVLATRALLGQPRTSGAWL